MRISSDEDDKGSFKKSDLVEVYYSAMSFPVNGDIKILPFFASLWRSMLLYLCSGPAEKRQSISCRPTECNPLVTDTHFASHEFCIAVSI